MIKKEELVKVEIRQARLVNFSTTETFFQLLKILLETLQILDIMKMDYFQSILIL
jgi:hypothetical protein